MLLEYTVVSFVTIVPSLAVSLAAVKNDSIGSYPEKRLRAKALRFIPRRIESPCVKYAMFISLGHGVPAHKIVAKPLEEL